MTSAKPTTASPAEAEPTGARSAEQGPKGRPKDDRYLTETANQEQSPSEDTPPPAPKAQQ